MENPPALAAAGDGGDAADTQADDGEDAGLAEREINRITVYFGTDREPFQPDWMWYANQFRWSFIALIIVPAVCFLGRLTLRPEIRRFLPLAGAALGLTAVVVAALAIYGGYRSMRMKQYMDRVGIAYGDERGAFDASDNEYCHLGRCRVSVPPARTAGVLHRPNPLRGDLWEEESRHYVVMQIEAIDSRPAFFDQVARAATISEGDRQRAFVFIHGFNVTFEGAALRTAQIAVDLDFDGVPIFYSWPSNGAVLEYTRDESAVAWATGHLKEFLADLRISMPDADIHLCAHSMGSRALTGAMRRLSRELAAEGARFQEVILAAPDIDAETFFHDIAPAMRPAAENVTLYSSSTDEALRVSKGIHGYPRAGDSGGREVYSQHLETVLVVRPRAHDLLGHSYYGDVPAVLQDMRRMIAGRLRPDDRGLTRTADRAWQLAVPNER
jgi:esterase/lipase superfamily enzyme